LKKGELVMLISENATYLTEMKEGKLHTQDGIFNFDDIAKIKFGEKIKTHLNREFLIAKPNINDILWKKCNRLPQIITPKDSSLILAYTGISQGSFVIDVGTGSGFLAIFLANYIKPGRVVTYEKDKKILKVATENVRLSGLSKFIKIKYKDATKGIAERDADLVTVDIQNPERVIRHAYKSLKIGGFLCIYSPTIEEVMAAAKSIRKLDFSYTNTVENIVREWQTERTTRPKTMGLLHTGFITFARKVK